MTRLQIILMLVLPLVNTAVTLLRNKDENSTGNDDLAADALEFAATQIQKYLTQPGP